MLDVPHVEQVHIFFRAELLDLDFAPGTESLEVRLFDEREIPVGRDRLPHGRDYVAALFRRPAHRAVRDFTRTRSRPRGPCPVHDSLARVGRPVAPVRIGAQGSEWTFSAASDHLDSLSRLIAGVPARHFPWYGAGRSGAVVVARSAHGPHDRCVQGSRSLRKTFAPRGARGDRLRFESIAHANASCGLRPSRVWPGSTWMAARSSRHTLNCTGVALRTRWKCARKERLVGGLYGVSLGRVFFFGERCSARAMLPDRARRTRAVLLKHEVRVIDCQQKH